MLCSVLLAHLVLHEFGLVYELQQHLQAGSAVLPTEDVYVHNGIRRLHSLNKYFPRFFANIRWSCQIIHNKNNIFGFHDCAFYPLCQMSVQIYHQLVYCFHYKYFELEIRKKILILNSTLLSPLLSLCKLIILWLLVCSTRAHQCTCDISLGISRKLQCVHT